MKKYSLTCKSHILELNSKTTTIMGILNVTPDSFSDGGKFFNPETAINHAKQMVSDGAGIIDIGGESTRPFAEPVSVQEEIDRVVPVIKALSENISVPVSVDTSKAAVAKLAIENGASIVNDISAMSDPLMAEVVAKNDVPIILMHMKGNPMTMQINPEYKDDPIKIIKEYLKDAILRAESSGISRKKIVVDPGIGFGKTVEQNLLIIKEVHKFLDLDIPVLIGSSRKSFIQKTLTNDKPDSKDVETGTQATISASVMGGAHIVRVHDVKNTASTIALINAIKNVHTQS